jgi:hypothetical protein
MPAAAELLATSGRHSLACAQATRMPQETTATPRAGEMSETVLTPTTSEFSQKFAKNSSERQNFEKKYQEKSENCPFFL